MWSKIIVTWVFIFCLVGSNAFHSPRVGTCHNGRMVTSPMLRNKIASLPTNTMSTLKMNTQMETVSESDTEEKVIPTFLPSECGVDYVPLATMLSLGDFLGADQFTRDNLIKISGAKAAGRDFVYWTEVKKMPETDLCTMERLWLQFSDGKFGYSIQKRVWDVENGNFDNFIRRIGWTKVENGIERKLKWFGKNEFIYDLNTAPKAHLPLTSALRGTQLLKELMMLPLWDKYDWKSYKGGNELPPLAKK